MLCYDNHMELWLHFPGGGSTAQVCKSQFSPAFHPISPSFHIVFTFFHTIFTLFHLFSHHFTCISPCFTLFSSHFTRFSPDFHLVSPEIHLGSPFFTCFHLNSRCFHLVFTPCLSVFTLRNYVTHVCFCFMFSSYHSHSSHGCYLQLCTTLMLHVETTQTSHVAGFRRYAQHCDCNLDSFELMSDLVLPSLFESLSCLYQMHINIHRYACASILILRMHTHAHAHLCIYVSISI